jgi:hypothetical protein
MHNNGSNASTRFNQSQKPNNTKNSNNGPWDKTCNDIGVHLEKLWKLLAKSSRSKSFHKCSKTISKKPLIERCNDWMKIN